MTVTHPINESIHSLTPGRHAPESLAAFARNHRPAWAEYALGHDLIEDMAVMLGGEQCFAMISAKHDVVATGGNVESRVPRHPCSLGVEMKRSYAVCATKVAQQTWQTPRNANMPRLTPIALELRKNKMATALAAKLAEKRVVLDYFYDPGISGWSACCIHGIQIVD